LILTLLACLIAQYHARHYRAYVAALCARARARAQRQPLLAEPAAAPLRKTANALAAPTFICSPH
jgi:hypothetical protein